MVYGYNIQNSQLWIASKSSRRAQSENLFPLSIDENALQADHNLYQATTNFKISNAAHWLQELNNCLDLTRSKCNDWQHY